ncbi:IS1380 family transposase [Streptococcus pneumoniae]|uniref:IS1380 family transposase n=1 Tax=Streptococcus pneumoniae TaxID=1313 RepID=UPI00061C0DAE|nr:IS1380 family transposase [Streptococcus pneumoniae]CKE71584.1 transposase-like protein%2C IS1380 ISSpn5 [Streptococcus pneumoniae]
MNSLPNHHFQNKSFYQLSFDGGHLTQYGGLIFFQELFSQLKLKERISKYLATNDQRRYCRYSDSDILVQFLFQLLTGYGTDYACKELSADAYFPKLLEGGQLASQPTLSRFLSRTDEETVHSLRCLNLELVEFFLQFHQLNQLIVDIDSTHFTTYGKQEGVAYNAHYRAHGYHPLYAFEGKTGYCFNAQLRPGNRYCSEEADSFITPVLERFNQLLFRMDSGFATPTLKSNSYRLNKKAKTIHKEMEDVEKKILYYEIYKAKKEVYEEYQKKNIFTKEAFYNKHKKDIDQYKVVSGKLKKLLSDKEKLSPKKWNEEKILLMSNLEEINKEKDKIKDEYQEINHIKYSVDFVNKELGIDLSIEIDKLIKQGEKPSVIAQIKKFQDQVNKDNEYREMMKNKKMDQER